MATLLGLLVVICLWQRDVLYQIYVANQVNAVGMVVNGGILVLFLGGLLQLIFRFYDYQSQEQDIRQFEENVHADRHALTGLDENGMVAARYRILSRAVKEGVRVNQSALAATLLAAESSRNSFLKFVHNVLILTGVFGTIISLSMSLLGASELLQIDNTGTSVFEQSVAQESSLGVMIFGMSTALSTTLTAIVAYLFFGYFFIKLTDTQTYLISRLEELTATVMVRHVGAGETDTLSGLVEESISLMRELDESRKRHTDAAQELGAAAEILTDKTRPQLDQQLVEHIVAMQKLIQINSHHLEQSGERLDEVIDLLQRGFRIGSGEKDSHG
ncbi:MAG: hypothetical protein F4093_00705 [Gammaproteobacteria bacterium]|nr:hypothetical protein [Gammaproteobacteria bacterium]MYJ51187.1 hypothetical protein [Gammaproteobacteria bacterium]